MSAIQRWKQSKREREEFVRWYSLIGAAYSGGGGGVGELVRCPVQPTVYHQAYDGANNYHEAPLAAMGYLEFAAKVHFRAIFGTALARMDEDIEALAAEARKEARELLGGDTLRSSGGWPGVDGAASNTRHPQP